jgi:hypothetical protein
MLREKSSRYVLAPIILAPILLAPKLVDVIERIWRINTYYFLS